MLHLKVIVAPFQGFDGWMFVFFPALTGWANYSAPSGLLFLSLHRWHGILFTIDDSRIATLLLYQNRYWFGFLAKTRKVFSEMKSPAGCGDFSITKTNNQNVEN
jgi:hypothetical protein